MGRRSLAGCLAATSVAGVAVIAPPADAQTNAPGGSAGQMLEELVVTARKREESLQRVPVAVSSATGAALESRNIRQPSDLARTVPSLMVQSDNAGSVNTATIILRGQYASDILLNMSQPVGVYEDGVNIPHPIGANGAFFDLERVEVLRGPQGTLYGRNTTGGAFNIITRGADFGGLHGYALVEIGNYSARRYGGAVNIPIVRKLISARFAYLHWGREGYGRSRVTGQRLGGDHDDDLARLSLAVAPDGPIRVDIRYERYRADRNGALSTIRAFSGDIRTSLEAAAYEDFATNQPRIFRGVALGDAAAFGAAVAAGRAAVARCVNDDLFTTCQGTVSYDRVVTQHGVIDIKWEPSDTVALRSVTGYHEFKNDRVFVLDGLPYQILGVGVGQGGLQPDIGSAPGPTPTFPLPVPHDQTSEQISQEFNVSGRLMERLDWLVGAFWANDRGSGAQPTIITPTLSRALSPSGTGSIQIAAHSALKVTNRTWALFAQNDLRVTSRISVTLGVRYTEEQLGQTLASWVYQTGTGQFTCTAAALAGRGPQGAIAGCAVAASAKFSGTSYLASLNLQLSPATLLYLKTARGFRGGALQGRDADAPAVGPETATDYEVGLKSDLFDHRLRTNLVAYQTIYDNKQEQRVVTNSLGALATIIQNAAKARIRGVEAELAARPTKRLTLFVNGSYIDAVYLSYPGALTNEGVIDASGVSFNLPRYQADFGGRYAFPLGPGALSVQADYAYRSKWIETVLAHPPNVIRTLVRDLLASRGLVNARIDFDVPDAGLTFSLFATNLTDERYQVPGGAPGSGLLVGQTQEPRMYGVTIRKRFGAD